MIPTRKSAEFWSCQVCTYVNQNNIHDTCEMCESPKLGNPKTSDTVQNSNSKDVCSFIDSNQSLNVDQIDDLNSRRETELSHNLYDQEEKIQDSMEFQSSLDGNSSFAVWGKSDQVEWKCSMCTFMNKGTLHLSCEMCGHERPTKEMEDMNFSQDLRHASFSTLQAYVAERSVRKQEERIMKLRIKEIAKHQDQLWEENLIEQGS